MPFIRQSDRSAFVRRLLSGVLLPGILSLSSLPALAGEGAPPGASTASPESEYSSLTLPVSNFGFRGVARDRFGSLYLPCGREKKPPWGWVSPGGRPLTSPVTR